MIEYIAYTALLIVGFALGYLLSKIWNDLP